MSTVANDAGVKPFLAVDDRISLLFIAADYAVTIAIIVAAIRIDHALATLVAIVLVAGRQVAFLNLVHSGAHYSLFSKRWMNDGADLLVSYIILDGVRPYRASHLPHHRLFTRKDPDRFEYLDERLSPNDGPWRRTWQGLVKPLLGGDGIAFLRATIDQARENLWWTWRLAVYWVVVLAALWWAGWLWYLVLYWFVPLVWLYPVFYHWAELSDHFATGWDDSRSQRGVFYSLFLKGHEMYHAAHHLYPRIPFYRIKAASKYLETTGERFETTRGFIDFMKILYRRTPSHAAVLENFKPGSLPVPAAQE